MESRAAAERRAWRFGEIWYGLGKAEDVGGASVGGCQGRASIEGAISDGN